MTYKLTVGLVSFLILSTVIHNVTSYCRFHLKNIGSRPLIIYKYKSDGTPIFHYPHNDTNCIVKDEDQRIHFACPGPNPIIQLFNVNIFGKERKNEDSTPVDVASGSMYILSDHNLIRGHSTVIQFASDTIIVQCLNNLVPKMIKTEEIRLQPSERSRNIYAVGYRLNEIDMLNVYEIVMFPKDQWITTHVRITSVIERRRFLNLEHKYEYMCGSIYQSKQLNFTELYSPEYQKASFQRRYKSSELTKNYFSSNNSLVIGQLIFKEDMFYAAEQMSTYYYENTVPIWKSVYEGNWQSVGQIIRTIVDESVRDLEVYVTTWGSFSNLDFSTPERSWVLGNSTSSRDFVAIPRLLVKAAVDFNNRNRGIVFHTYNDPYLDLKRQSVNVCSQTTDCEELNPKFKNLMKGYTFCCHPKHSFLFQKMLLSK